MHKMVWHEGCMKLADIGTNNVRGYGLIPILGYAMLILDN